MPGVPSVSSLAHLKAYSASDGSFRATRFKDERCGSATSSTTDRSISRGDRCRDWFQSALHNPCLDKARQKLLVWTRSNSRTRVLPVAVGSGWVRTPSCSKSIASVAPRTRLGAIILMRERLPLRKSNWSDRKALEFARGQFNGPVLVACRRSPPSPSASSEKS